MGQTAQNAQIGNEEFAALMADVGLGAPDTCLAVAVSGGADSMALALLVHEWSAGRAVALTFDHRLRAESAAEAKQVGDWLSARGMDHHILGWRGPKPDSDIQAAARAARYRALEGWCAKNGVTSLLLAHHMEDQAETFMMRLARGSGIDGLAAMEPLSAPVSAQMSGGRGPNLLRPLLAIPRNRLRATLEAAGQPWIEDPSNQERSFLRVRVREFLNDTDIDGLDAPRLARTASTMRRARQALERMTGELLKDAVNPHPAGFARVRLAPILAADEEISLRALSRLVACYGGRSYPPRLDGLLRLWAELGTSDYVGSTLAGVRVESAPLEGEAAFLMCREEGTINDEADLRGGSARLWDGRFLISCEGACDEVSRLGDVGWQEIVAKAPELKNSEIPYPVRLSLPAFRFEGEIAVVPYLGYDSGLGVASGSGCHASAVFAPVRPLFPSTPGAWRSASTRLTER